MEVVVEELLTAERTLVTATAEERSVQKVVDSDF